MRADPATQVHIVGMGPGADDRYLTQSARRAISEADVVIFPGTQIGDPIRALVRGELRWGRWFDDAEIRGWIQVAVAAGQQVAWLFAGDPTLYGGEPLHFGSLSINAGWLRDQGYGFEIHPGVSSLQALLSRLGLEHARPDTGCPMVMYAPGRDTKEVARGRIESLAALGVPLALFLADASVVEVVEIGIRHFGPTGRVVLGHRVGWPDEWVINTTLGEISRVIDISHVPKHTLLLVGPWHG